MYIYIFVRKRFEWYIFKRSSTHKGYEYYEYGLYKFITEVSFV